MSLLEYVSGFFLGLVSLLILVVRMLFSFGDASRYLKSKTM